MLIFFEFDNDDMESSKRQVTFFIVDFSFKINKASKQTKKNVQVRTIFKKQQWRRLMSQNTSYKLMP